MKIQLYHSKTSVVQLIFTIERYDIIAAKRTVGWVHTYQGHCPKCLAMFSRTIPRYCPRCLPVQVRVSKKPISYGVYRAFYNRKVKELWNQPLISFPVAIESLLEIGNRDNRNPDVDNIGCFVTGLLSGAVIADDRLVWDSRVRKLRNPTGDNRIIVYLDMHETNYHVRDTDEPFAYQKAVDTLSRLVPGKRVYIPKKSMNPIFRTEPELIDELYKRFTVVTPAGHNYFNVITEFREKNPAFNWLSDRRIRDYYQAWRKLAKKGE